MPIYYLTNEEIKTLRSELMNRRSKSCSYYSIKRSDNNYKNNSSKSFSQLYKENRNSEIGHLFEANVRETLSVEFNWTKEIPKRHFFYRTITIGKKIISIPKENIKKIIINGKRFKFSLNQNKTLSIHSGGPLRRFITNISEKNKATQIYINDTKVIISRLKEIEIDCFNKINSNFIKIIGDDLICLYTNISQEFLKNAKYACCEIKLNKSKIKLLVKQLVKDKAYLENLMRFKNIVYIGFVGSGFINNTIIDELNDYRNINLIIFEIKNFCWLQRDLTNYIDWETVRTTKANEKKLNVLDHKLDLILNSLGINIDDNNIAL